MSKRALLAVVCFVCVLGVAPSSANAASVTHQTCTSQITWSITLTSAVHTATNVTCYQADALASIDGLFPEFDIHGQGNANDPGPYSGTWGYNPLAGLCLGTLSRDDAASTGTGVMKNEGNGASSLGKVVMRSKANPHTVLTITSVGVLQPSCSASWSGTAVWDLAIAQT
jgi:hypothetical protein